MRKWVDELFIIIMDMLQDSSLLAKRQVSAATSWLSGAGSTSSRTLTLLVTSVSLAHSRYSEIFAEWVKRRKTWSELWLLSWLRVTLSKYQGRPGPCPLDKRKCRSSVRAPASKGKKSLVLRLWRPAELQLTLPQPWLHSLWALRSFTFGD